MSSLLGALALSLLLAITCDWLVSTRIAAYYSEFEYNFSFAFFRTAVAILTAIYGVFYTRYLNNPDTPAITALLPCAFGLALFVWLTLRDVRANLRPHDADGD